MKLTDLTNDFIIAESKTREYLLNLEHTEGGAEKANFLIRFGFVREEWEILEHSLLEHGKTHDIINQDERKWGVFYEIRGSLSSPDDRNPTVNTVWLIEENQTAAKFITLIPR